MKTKQLLSIALFTAAMAVSSASFAQVKIGTNPTTIDPNNNLEIEASTPNRKTFVNKTTGQVSVLDGTEGAGKVFTSDANGNASWQSLPSAQNSEVMVSAKLTTTQSLAALVVTKLNFNSEFFDKGNRFDLTTDQVTVPNAGFYAINTGITRAGSPALNNSIAGFIFVNNANYVEGNLWDSSIPAGAGYTVGTTRLIYLNAGDVVDIRLRSNFTAEAIALAYFQIYKISN